MIQFGAAVHRERSCNFDDIHQHHDCQEAAEKAAKKAADLAAKKAVEVREKPLKVAPQRRAKKAKVTSANDDSK